MLRLQFTMRTLLLIMPALAALFAGVHYEWRRGAERRDKARRLTWPTGEFAPTLWQK